tara:strand:- start:40 stop:1194 length:1155 start_codon:yes stop_codon:yes gene_type:complete
MAETKFKFADGHTKLHKNDYRPKALQFRKNSDKFQSWVGSLRDKYGQALWDTKGNAVKNPDDGVKHYVGAAGANSVKIVDEPTRKKTQAANLKNREINSKQQTVGERDFSQDAPRGYQKHHIKKLSQYSPFFENLNEKEAAELAKFAADKGFDLGDKELNALLIKTKPHTAFHIWESKEGFTKGGLKKIKGPHIPDMAKASMDDRKYALIQFLNNEQPKLDAKIRNLTGQMPESKNIKDFGEKFVKGIKGSQRGLKILRNAPRVGKGLGFLIDAGGAIAGTNELASGQGNRLQNLKSSLDAFSGATGLASLSPVSPVATPLSFASAGLASVVGNRIDRDKKKEAAQNLFLNPKNIQANTPSGNAVLDKPASQLSLRSRYRHGKR